jgi:hypothetical protein
MREEREDQTSDTNDSTSSSLVLGREDGEHDRTVGNDPTKHRGKYTKYRLKINFHSLCLYSPFY